MMRALQSYLMSQFKKYEPVHGDAVESGDECCVHCGKFSDSVVYKSNKLQISIWALLGLVLIISLSMIFHGAFQGIAQEREKLLFEEIFGEG
jgi:hypothetical protein